MTSLVPPLSNQHLSEALELMKRALKIWTTSKHQARSAHRSTWSKLSGLPGQGEGVPSGVQRLIEQLEGELSRTDLVRGETPNPWEILEV
jgi:hypothetical protein